MHAYIEVNTVQSVCVNKREKNEREKERERERERRNYDCCCSYRRIHIRERDIIHIYIQIKQLCVVTTFLDMMKFGLLLFLLFILSIISSINTDGLFRRSIFQSENTFEKLRHKASNSKYCQILLSILIVCVTVADNLLLL
jgi:hypothetical protein